MKNSGIEWIGEIPDSWEVKRVKDVFSLIGGCGFKDEFQGHLDGDYPFCKASDINGKDKFLDHAQNYVNQDIVDEQHYKVVPQYSILMSKIGEAMKKNHRKINTVPCIVDNNCQALCKKSNDDIIYLYYLFSQIDMIWFDNGGTIPNISNTKLLNFFIPDISVELQKHIAYYLDKKCGKIDKMIANQQVQIEKLKEYKQSVITEAVTKGLDKSAPMKDSGIEWIGEIPTHWDIIATKSLFDVIAGATPDSSNPLNWDGEIRWITPADYKTEDIYVEFGRRNLSKIGFNSCSTSLIPAGNIIFSKRAPIGAVVINNTELCTNQGCLSCVNKGLANIKFYYYIMSIATEQYELLGSGTTFKEISCNTFSNFRLPYPSLETQRQIADYLDEKCGKIDQLIAIKQEKIKKLQEYKKSLIYEYVTGKKEVV